MSGIAAVVGIVAMVMFSTALRPAPHGKGNIPPVESFAIEQVDTLNARIATAAGAGETWVKDPVRIALAMVEQGSDAIEERCYLNVIFEGTEGERPWVATVTVITDGYLGDSVRGQWCRFEMKREAGLTWRVTKLHRAWRCYRGHHLGSFSKQPCL